MGTGMSMMNKSQDLASKMGKQTDKATQAYIKEMKQMYGTLQGVTSTIKKTVRENPAAPELKTYIWPWNNFDFDYSNFVYNNYDPTLLKNYGSNGYKYTMQGDGYLDVTENDLIMMADNYKSMLRTDPIPNQNTFAGKVGTDGDVFPGETQLKKVKEAYNKITEPYPGFRKEYKQFFIRNFGNQNPPAGRHSSSYFIRTGNCPMPDITDAAECKQKGFQWNPVLSIVDGSIQSFFPSQKATKKTAKCFKPRYAFIDNSPGSLYPGNDVGTVPTISKTMSNLNPLELSLAAIYGRTSDGSYQLLPCNPSGEYEDEPITAGEIIKKKETFVGNQKKNSNIWRIILCLLIIFSLVYVILYR